MKMQNASVSMAPSNRLNSSGLYIPNQDSNFPEFVTGEFYADSVNNPTINPNWSSDTPTASQAGSFWPSNNTYKKGLIKLSINPALVSRRIYAYLWSNPLATTGSVRCQISFYYNNQKIVSWPLTYTAALNAIPITFPAKSLFSLPVGGGNVDDSSPIAFLYSPMPVGGGGTDPETNYVILQPFRANFKCDTVELDLISWSNVEVATSGNSRFRAILISIAE